MTVTIEAFAVDRKVERCLMAVAAHMGNCNKAEEMLAEDGIAINKATLWRWSRKQHAERYAEIRAQALPLIRAQAADEHIELAKLSMEAERLIAERLATKVDEIPARDLAGAGRNLAVSAGVHTQNAQLLNDQPTQRVSVDLAGTLKELKAMGVDPQQILDAEVVEEEDVTTDQGKQT